MKTLHIAVAVCMGGAALTAAAHAAVPQDGPQQRFSFYTQNYDTQPGGSDRSTDMQAKDELLAGLENLGANAKERNEVNLDKNMMALVGGRKGGHYADLAQKIDFIVVRNYEYAKKGDYNKSDIDALRKRLEGNGWTHIVRNESEGESNDIVIKPAGDGTIADMVILNAEAKELNIVHLRGHFRMEDVNGAMGATMGLNLGTMGLAGTMVHVPSPTVNVRVLTPMPPVTPSPAQIEEMKQRAQEQVQRAKDRQKELAERNADRQKEMAQRQVERQKAQAERDRAQEERDRAQAERDKSQQEREK